MTTLFEPVRIGNIDLANRILTAPLTLSVQALHDLCAAESSRRVVHHTREDAEADKEHFDGKTTE